MSGIGMTSNFPIRRVGFGRPTSNAVEGIGGRPAVPIFPQPRPGVSSSDMIQHKASPGMSKVRSQDGKRFLNLDEANNLGPLTMPGWNSPRRGYGGGSGRIGSAAGALGSGGIPTSQRGRFDDVMMEGGTEQDAIDAAMTPAWAMERPDPFKPNPRYGNMGRPPIRQYATGTRDSGPKPQVALVGEEGPEVMVVPPRSAIIPNGIRMPSDIVQTAFDEVSGNPETESFLDGEVRMDAEGNEWRYDAKQGRGIPVNPYLASPNAPMDRSSFATSPKARYDDLAMRLDALRKEGFREGRAAVGRVQGEQAAEEARRAAFLASGKPVAESEGGGKVYTTPYGTAIVGGNRPKSFTVENFEGGQVTTPDLKAADRESMADAAERRVSDGSAQKGDSLAGYRARPNAVPTAIEELVGPEPSPVPVARATEGDPDDATGAREKAFAWTKSPIAAAKRLQELRSEALDKKVSAPPATPRPRTSRFQDFVTVSEQEAGNINRQIWDAAREAADLPEAAWDYIFNPEGTKNEREARRKGEEATKKLEKRGFKFKRDDQGNIVAFDM